MRGVAVRVQDGAEELRQHTSAYEALRRQHTSAYLQLRVQLEASAYVSIRQHTSAYEALSYLRVELLVPFLQPEACLEVASRLHCARPALIAGHHLQRLYRLHTSG